MPRFQNLQELRKLLMKEEKNASLEALKKVTHIRKDMEEMYHKTHNPIYKEFMDECDYSIGTIRRKLNVIRGRKIKISKSKSKSKSITNKIMNFLKKKKSGVKRKRVYS